MVWEQEVTVNLSRLLRSDPFSEGEVEASGQFMPDVDLSKDDIELQEPLSFHLVVRSVGDGEFLLQGTVSGQVLMPCGRCLKPLEVGWESDLVYSMEFRPGQAELNIQLDEDDDEVLIFGTPEVDFSVLLTEVFIVDRPLTVAHPKGDPDCEDLASIYRQDLEIASSDESPFAALKDFDVESKEE